MANKKQEKKYMRKWLLLVLNVRDLILSEDWGRLSKVYGDVNDRVSTKSGENWKNRGILKIDQKVRGIFIQSGKIGSENNKIYFVQRYENVCF